MLSKYNDFIRHNPRYKQLEFDDYYKNVFNFLLEKPNIISMIEASKWEKPALSGCVVKLEKKFPDLLGHQYKGNFIKQSIGTMIKEVLAPFGYIPDVPKRISPVKSEFFISTHTYRLDKNLRRLELVQTWEIVEVQNLENKSL